MRLPKGIFVKLVTVFLVVGLVPLLALSLWTYTKAREGMTETVIEYWLVRQARDAAARIDREVQSMRTLIRSWADDAILAAEMAKLVPGAPVPDMWGLDESLHQFLERRRNYQKDLDVLLLVDREGYVVADSSVGSVRLSRQRIQSILPVAADREWIEHALRPSAEAIRQPTVPVSTQDWHISPLVAKSLGQEPFKPSPKRAGESVAAVYPDNPSAYAVGFAGTIVTGDQKDQPVGALIGVFNWQRIQGVLDEVTTRFQAPDDPLKEGRRYPSGYPFLFASDRDTIIGHKFTQLLGGSLARDHGLAAFRERMDQAPYGSYSYEYPAGVQKISGYAHTASARQEGFGWTVGVGINDQEIYGDVRQLRNFMVISALLVTGLVVLLAAVFSHRITEPITRLIAYTEEVARGKLDARVDIHTRDEIAVLADSFNKMAEDLGESNRRLIQAEKDKAWREMARQVAHEIKNPLTPIMLSAQQLQRAHLDRHPAFDEILAESVHAIVDQCEGLRRIASDFAAFASFPKRNVTLVPIRALVHEIVTPYKNRSEHAIQVSFESAVDDAVKVEGDRDELRRVFLNLFNNAMESMPNGGRLQVRVTHDADRGLVRISVQDDGCGIAESDIPRLFEPSFSTRTGGTGLGLAICQRIVKEHGGSIEVASTVGQGSSFEVHLPARVSPGEG